MAETVLSYRCIPLWLLRAYLEDLGGESGEDGCIAGEGWQARLTKMEDFHLGSLRLGQVRLELQGDETALARLRPELDKKTMRAGA